MFPLQWWNGDVRELSDAPAERGNTRCITHLHFASATCVVWPRGLRRRYFACYLLELRVRIPPRPWVSVYCECFRLSGIGLCGGPITRPEESYRVQLVFVFVCVMINPRECAARSIPKAAEALKTKTSVTDTTCYNFDWQMSHDVC
jgi:hypothetical protein